VKDKTVQPTSTTSAFLDEFNIGDIGVTQLAVVQSPERHQSINQSINQSVTSFVAVFFGWAHDRDM